MGLMRARRVPREWPALEPVLFVGALAIYAAAVPLGLERPGAGRVVAEGWILDGGSGEAPWALLAIRLLGFLPLGDAATRAALASALAGAAAGALGGRLACEGLSATRRGIGRAAGGGRG